MNPEEIKNAYQLLQLGIAQGASAIALDTTPNTQAFVNQFFPFDCPNMPGRKTQSILTTVGSTVCFVISLPCTVNAWQQKNKTERKTICNQTRNKLQKLKEKGFPGVTDVVFIGNVMEQQGCERAKQYPHQRFWIIGKESTGDFLSPKIALSDAEIKISFDAHFTSSGLMGPKIERRTIPSLHLCDADGMTMHDTLIYSINFRNAYPIRQEILNPQSMVTPLNRTSPPQNPPSILGQETGISRLLLSPSAPPDTNNQNTNEQSVQSPILSPLLIPVNEDLFDQVDLENFALASSDNEPSNLILNNWPLTGCPGSSGPLDSTGTVSQDLEAKANVRGKKRSFRP